MTTRTMRAWAVLLPAALVLAALAVHAAWLTAVAEGSALLGVSLVVALDGLRERGRPRRR